ncbi:MAG: LysR family transcriptional regulator, partial [Oscillospiraceae bacterium]|nr:LysR family transcriptional regulator [Oscillospiraceae bacterium]
MYSQQIRIFVYTAERGSFTKAAEELFVTPASIMKHMNSLEDRLGLTLLKRTNQGIELTEAGKHIYKSAKKIIAESEKAVAEAKAVQQREAAVIRVGSSFLNPAKPLIDMWHKISPATEKYRIKIVPYSDDHDNILSVVASLGKTIDFMVGVFDSQQMLSMGSFFELGRCRMCIAVPREHKLASKEKLTLSDIHGEKLTIVKSGDTLQLDNFREMLKMTHPQIIIEDAHYFYDIDTFNTCEATGSLLLTIESWSDIHPSLMTLPVEWDVTVPYG